MLLSYHIVFDFTVLMHLWKTVVCKEIIILRGKNIISILFSFLRSSTKTKKKKTKKRNLSKLLFYTRK